MFNTAGLLNTETLGALANPATAQFSQAPGLFSGALSGIGNMFAQKPEALAMTMDQVGSRLAPDNAFAGVGTGLAKSSLANKAEKERMGQQQSIMKLLASLTAKGAAGGDAVTFKVDDKGNYIANTSMTIPKAGETKTSAPLATAQAAAPPVGPNAQQPAEAPEIIMQRLQNRAFGIGE